MRSLVIVGEHFDVFFSRCGPKLQKYLYYLLYAVFDTITLKQDLIVYILWPLDAYFYTYMDCILCRHTHIVSNYIYSIKKLKLKPLVAVLALYIQTYVTHYG